MMSIELEDEGSDASSDDANDMTLRELYTTLLLEDDIIIVIARTDLESVKKGLTSVKAKENMKLKNKGMPVDTATLQFVELPCDDCGAEDMRIQISLLKKKTITIKRIETPSEF